MTIGFIGGGNMAGALIKGLIGAGKREIMVSEPRPERREYLTKTLGVRAVADNASVLKECAVVVLAVKPQQMEAVLGEVAPHVTDRHVVVSIAAGITIGFIESRLKTRRIVRVMPNVGSLAQAGMAVISLCECMDEKDVVPVRDIFMASGHVLVMPEKYINAVTALSGSGPAFIARFVQFMIEAGKALGLPEREAMELGLQTLAGTARLLEGGITPEDLVRMVKSPGGTTEAGLGEFDAGGLGDLVARALKAAERRAGELAR